MPVSKASRTRGGLYTQRSLRENGRRHVVVSGLVGEGAGTVSHFQ